jgi:hypothetical protein
MAKYEKYSGIVNDSSFEGVAISQQKKNEWNATLTGN